MEGTSPVIILTDGILLERLTEENIQGETAE